MYVNAASCFWNSKNTFKVLWLWTAFTTAWFMVPRVSFWLFTASADHTLPVCEMWSRIHIWTCATIQLVINDRHRRRPEGDFGLKFSSLQIKHLNCLMLTQLSAVAFLFAFVLGKSYVKRERWVLTTARLQLYTFQLSPWPHPGTGLSYCGSCSEKPPLSLYPQAPPSPLLPQTLF